MIEFTIMIVRTAKLVQLRIFLNTLQDLRLIETYANVHVDSTMLEGMSEIPVIGIEEHIPVSKG